MKKHLLLVQAVFLFTLIVGTCLSEEEEGLHAQDESKLPQWAQILLAVCLVCISALLAGLTIGIMGLDTLSLEIIADSGSEPDRSYAEKLLPVRKMGHQALCTLLLGNMWANVMIAEFCADVNPEGGGGSEEGEEGGSSGLIGFLLSTLIILIFAEIVPMSVCKSSNALKIAAGGVPILRVFLVLLWPVAWPLGKLLDKLIHHDVGQVYDRNELKKLMTVHFEQFGDVSGLQRTERDMMLGAMEFSELCVGDTMVKIDKVFMLEETELLDDELLAKIWEEGHSRIPICGVQNRQNVLGVLYAKDLLMLKSERKARTHSETVLGSPVTPKDSQSGVPSAGEFLKRTQSRGGICTVSEKMRLPSMLNQLQSGRSHLFFVTREADGEFPMTADTGVKTTNESFSTTTVYQPGGASGTTTPSLIGIVTLEDIIERLIGSDILDEDDGGRKRRVNFHGFNTNSSKKHSTGLSDAELFAVSNFLRASCQDSFAHFEAETLKDGLRSFATVRDIIPGDQSASNDELVLYKRNAMSSVFTLILSGSVDVTIRAGSETFPSRYKRFSWLGEGALHGEEFLSSVDAVVAGPTKILELTRRNYEELLKSQ